MPCPYFIRRIFGCKKNNLKDFGNGDDGLEAALEELGGMTCWLWVMFLLACLPGILNVWHLTEAVFISFDSPYWCDIEQLHGTNWTQDEIRTIVTGDSDSNSCEAKDWNYDNLSKMNFDDALKFTKEADNPGTFKCEHRNYIGSNVQKQWDLTCEKSSLKSLVQMMIVFGKFIGAFIFGVISDKYGRKCAITLSSITYIASAVMSFLTTSYPVFIIARFGLGMAGSGVYNSGFTLITELATAKYRTLFGNIFNIPYCIGMVSLPLIAYYVQDDWMDLQMILSAPSVLLVIPCIFLPESPRWLINEGRREEAWDIVKRATGNRRQPTSAPNPVSSNAAGADEPKIPLRERCAASVKKITLLFQHPQIRWRTLICYFGTCCIAITYYVITLSSDNFNTDRFLYIIISGNVEAVSYIFPVILLMFIGRRFCCGVMLLGAGVTLTSILAIPSDYAMVVMTVANVGRLCIGTVYSVIILYTSELFPTEIRNTAVGTCSTLSNAVSLTAPFLVYQGGEIHKMVPSTLCGALCVFAGLLMLLLPETKGKILSDTVDELMAKENETTSMKNCCVFR